MLLFTQGGNLVDAGADVVDHKAIHAVVSESVQITVHPSCFTVVRFMAAVHKSWCLLEHIQEDLQNIVWIQLFWINEWKYFSHIHKRNGERCLQLV